MRLVLIFFLCLVAAPLTGAAADETRLNDRDAPLHPWEGWRQHPARGEMVDTWGYCDPVGYVMHRTNLAAVITGTQDQYLACGQFVDAQAACGVERIQDRIVCSFMFHRKVPGDITFAPEHFVFNPVIVDAQGRHERFTDLFLVSTIPPVTSSDAPVIWREDQDLWYMTVTFEFPNRPIPEWGVVSYYDPDLGDVALRFMYGQ